MPKPLPDQPNLEQLKKQAKELLKQLKSGDPAALERVHTQDSGRQSSHRQSASWSLTDAQFVMAREYGFPSWTKLKSHVTQALEQRDPGAVLHAAFQADDAAGVSRLLTNHPEFKARINEPLGPFDSPAIIHVKSRRMLDVLVEAGADLNAKSRWWAGGFGLLHWADPELAAYAVERGAKVDIHAAARLGLVDRLRELVTREPALVHARGGDGQTALHFAATVEVAALLLEHGAELDARDVDHESTPAQYMVRDRQEVLRYLVRRGCETDLFIAAALGDQPLAERLLEANPACLRMRVCDEDFPRRNHRSGGTIYQWTLGWHVSAPQVADNFGHHALAEWLIAQSPPEVRLVEACWRGDSEAVREQLRQDANLLGRLDASERRQVAHAARNNNLPAVIAFLAAGFPVDVRGQHGATPLHWAAWHGNVEMVRALLRYAPPLEAKDMDYQGTPLKWAMHGSENGWHKEKGQYGPTVGALLEAGAIPPETPSGTDAVRDALRGKQGAD